MAKTRKKTKSNKSKTNKVKKAKTPTKKKKKKVGLAKAVEALLVRKPKASYNEALKLAKSIKPDTKFDEKHFCFYTFRAKKIRNTAR